MGTPDHIQHSRTHRCRIATAFDEQVSRVKTTVDPDGWARPVPVWHPLMPRSPRPCRSRAAETQSRRGSRHPAWRAAPPGGSCATRAVGHPRRRPLQGGQELRQAGRQLARAGVCPRCSASRPPASHKRTTHRDTPRRAPLDERDRDGKGQERSESRKPVAFLLRCAAGPLPTG